jgi:Cu(I)/Ag(I) efflux system membrane protein CusA/SilA
VWVGFLALFGIATDDGLVMTTYLEQVFERDKPDTIDRIRAAVLEAGMRRVRPCLMTSATTLLALLPVMTSRGRGAEIMVPMAIPAVGGVTLTLLAMLIVPVMYCGLREWRAGRGELTVDN